MQLLQKDNMSANVRKLSGIEAWDKYGIEQAWEYTHAWTVNRCIINNIILPAYKNELTYPCRFHSGLSSFSKVYWFCLLASSPAGDPF